MQKAFAKITSTPLNEWSCQDMFIIDEFYYRHKAIIYKWLRNFCVFIRLWANQTIIIADFQLNMFELGLSVNPISLDDPEDNSSSLKSKLE